MSADLSATRKLIAAVLKGERPEESLARTALAEVNTFSADVVAVTAPDEPSVHPVLAVTADEAVAALIPMFNNMEAILVDLRAKLGGKLVISTAMANSFILAHHVLKKAGHEPIKHRKVEPLNFVPVTIRAG